MKVLLIVRSITCGSAVVALVLAFFGRDVSAGPTSVVPPPIPIVLPSAASLGNVHMAASLAECQQHAQGRTDCAEMSTGYHMLVWDPVDRATKYNVYRIATPNVLAGVVEPVDGKLATTFGIVTVPLNSCFSISPVVDKKERSMDTPWCLHLSGTSGLPPGGAKTVVNVVPGALHVATTLAECQAHDGNDMCDPLRGSGSPTSEVLVWSGTFDSYSMYRVDGGAHTKVWSTVIKYNGVSPTARIMSNVPAGACYAVTGVLGGTESAASSPFCFSKGTALTMTLKPAHMRSYTTANSGVSGGLGKCFTGTDQSSSSPGLIVGYRHDTGTPCKDAWDNHIARGGLFFDLTPLAHRAILRATLELPVSTTYVSEVHYAGAGNSNSLACATKASAGTAAAWWDAKGPLLHAEPTIAFPANATTVDLTSIVAAWMQGPAQSNGLVNHGLILQGANEDTKAFTETACMTTYQSAGVALVVVYQ